jgi:hypothetical protein
MRDRGLIIGGLILFLGVITTPVWYNAAAGTLAKAPDLKLPTQEKNCVAPVEYMRTFHMDLLMDWRDQAVRQNIRTFKAFDGKTYTIGLSQTCLKCHTSKADFCDRCHEYAGVKPTCWNCHVDPTQVQRSTT